MDNSEIFKRRYERERAARKEAEMLLEEKSLQLYKTNQKLSALNESLELKVKERTRQLEQMNEELEKFTYISSHDLKTPLRSINHIAHWIEEDFETESKEDIFKNIQLLKTRVQRMENLINGILEYTNVGKEKSMPAMVDIEKLVSEICNYESTRQQYTFNISLNMPVMNTYRLRLFRIFSNLIGNAIKHNDKFEKIVNVGCNKLDEGLYEFYVEDNGNGISEAFHHKIFEMFQTL